MALKLKPLKHSQKTRSQTQSSTLSLKKLKLKTTNSKRHKPLTPTPKQQSRLNLPKKLHLPDINPKLFSLSLLLYFFFFLFLDQVSPEKVANLPLANAYLPFHLLLFAANLSLLLSFLSLETSFLLAFFIELIFFFKLQGFVINWPLILSLLIFIGLIKLVFWLWHKFKLSRKLKTTKVNPPKLKKLSSRHHRRSRLAR